MSRGRSGSSDRGVKTASPLKSSPAINQSVDSWISAELAKKFEDLERRIPFPFLVLVTKEEANELFGSDITRLSEIEKKFDVEILVSKAKELPVNFPDRFFELHGASHQQKCLALKHLAELLTNNRNEAGDSTENSQITLLVPSICAPMVVGSRGATLARVRKESGVADIKVDDRSLLNTHCRPVRMCGSLVSVVHSVASIQDIIADYVGNGKVKQRDLKIVGVSPGDSAAISSNRKWDREIERLNRDPRLAYRLSPDYDPRMDPTLDSKTLRELLNRRERSRSRDKNISHTRDRRRSRSRSGRRGSRRSPAGSRTQSRSRSRSRGRDSGPFLPPLRCLIPAEAAGWIIGNKGSGLQKYKDRTGAEVVVNRTDRSDEVTDRFVIVRGDKEARIRATERVIEDIRDFHETKSSDRGVFVLVIPEDTGPIVVGSRGTTVQAIMKDSDCDIDIPKEKIPGTNDKPVKITGSLKGTVKAVERIQSILDDHAKRHNRQAEDYDVPGYKFRR